MTVVKLTVEPDQTPEEEAALVARVAAAVSESTGDDTVSFEITKPEDVSVSGSVADRMTRGSRWSS
jgi:phenylpyruvate tautomerase PptA (4-oxalocrotonate tautomerase family)